MVLKGERSDPITNANTRSSNSILTWMVVCTALTVGRAFCYSPAFRLKRRPSFAARLSLLPNQLCVPCKFVGSTMNRPRSDNPQQYHRVVLTLSSSSSEATSSSNAAASCIEHGNKLFNDHIWEAYEELMTDIMTRDRVTKKQNTQELQAVQEYLLSNRQCMETLSIFEVAASNETNASFRDVATEQKTQFVNATGFNKSQYDYLTRCLSYTGDVSAKKQSSQPVMVTWHKMKECGLIPRENTVSTYMYVLGLSSDAEKACLEVATFHDLLFDPNEKTVTLRIKSLIGKGDATAAERVLRSLPCKGKSREWKRLRTFTPILQYYCDHGEMESALRLFRQMRESDGVHLDAETYAILISSLARNGCFRKDAKPIDNVAEYGFSASNGPALFDVLATEMAEDILELPEEAAKIISDALAERHSDEGKKGSNGFVGRVTINSSTATCPETGVKLQLFTLTDEQRSTVHDTLLNMATIQHEEFGEKLRAQGKTKESKNAQYAYEQLCNFSKWLCHREGDPFTAIMDGPNIAYYGHGDVHYRQIELVLEELERLGERPLVVMPQKYTAQSFWVAGLGFTQELSEKDMSIIKKLIDNRKMYVVPSGCLDDYYWMLASVANQPGDLSNTDTNRLSGLRPLLITNDQMRDHKLSLLEPRAFRRWTSCHVVNYDIKPYVEDECESREVEFFPADKFSKEIQGNKAEKYEGNNMAWHFPVTGWPESDRLCVCLVGSFGDSNTEPLFL